MAAGVWSLASLAPDLQALAKGLRALAGAKAQDLIQEPALQAIRQSNAEIFGSRGRAIGATWGTYRAKRAHPLPKEPGVKYWLIDKDYYTQMHLRTSLTQVGRHPRGRVVYRGRVMRWYSTLPYATAVNRQYGRIYGLTPRGKRLVMQAVVARARQIADLAARGREVGQ